MTPLEVTSEQLATLTPERLAAVQGLVMGWLSSPTGNLPTSAELAQAAANDWLLERLPDRFTALEPHLIAGGDIWSVPVGLAYPQIGVIGQVGEVLVSAFSRGIISATQPDEMKLTGMERYREQENEIKAAFLSAGNA